jgi:multiple sugar transport system permease protein
MLPWKPRRSRPRAEVVTNVSRASGALLTRNPVGTAPRRPRRGSKRARVAPLLFLSPVLLFALLFFVYPLVKNIQVSLQHYDLASLYTGDAAYVGLRNYANLPHDPIFRTAVGNTIEFTLLSIVFQLTIGLALAVFFVRQFPLNALLRSLLLVPWLLPLVVSGTVFRWMLDTNNGIINHVLLDLHLVREPVPWLTGYHTAMIGVLLCNIWIGIPFNTVILYGGLQGIPVELYEASALDGAGGWRQFRYITLPLLRPVLTVVTTLGLIYTLKIFDVIWVLTKGGPADATQNLTTYGYTLSFGGLSQFGAGAAVGNVLIVASLGLALIYLRTVRGEGEVG